MLFTDIHGRILNLRPRIVPQKHSSKNLAIFYGFRYAELSGIVRICKKTYDSRENALLVYYITASNSFPAIVSIFKINFALSTIVYFGQLAWWSVP